MTNAKKWVCDTCGTTMNDKFYHKKTTGHQDFSLNISSGEESVAAPKARKTQKRIKEYAVPEPASNAVAKRYADMALETAEKVLAEFQSEVSRYTGIVQLMKQVSESFSLSAVEEKTDSRHVSKKRKAARKVAPRKQQKPVTRRAGYATWDSTFHELLSTGNGQYTDRSKLAEAAMVHRGVTNYPAAYAALTHALQAKKISDQAGILTWRG